MKALLIINDAPYGTERCYNALRIAHSLMKLENAQVDLFLMADAVTAARRDQRPPEGYYNIELMLKRVLRGSGRVMLCGTCMEARGLTADQIADGATVSNMAELAQCVASADRLMVF